MASEAAETMKADKPLSAQAETVLYDELKECIIADIEHSNNWRVAAKEEFSFVAGPGQWETDDIEKLRDEKRPPVTFNKTLKFIRAVCGIEVNNRQQTTYIASDPTEAGEVKANEMATQGGEWMDAQCNALRKKSRAFRDLLICGMGWGESVMSWDEDPRGKYVLERCNPLEMGWDHNARDQNLMDAKRRWRCRKMLLSEAKDFLAGLGIDPRDFTDTELDATWAADVGAPKDSTKTKEQKEKREDNMLPYEGKREVHIVQVQWCEFERYFRTINPAVSQDPTAPPTVDMSEDEFKKANKASGNKLPGARLRRKVYKQAFLGGKLLKSMDGPRPDGFTLHCMTGEADDNEGTWFGLVRVMRDPQVWANKFFSQLMHIVNSTAKGGILFETDAVTDARTFMQNYAKPNAATEVAAGAISKGKIMAKPGVGVTSGVAALLQIANDAFGDTTGINLELMGLADRDQPGVLEAQRKQAAMTILATLFDSLSLWEQERGQTKLYFLQTYLADGRLIRIHGDDGMQAIRLLKSSVFGKFDCIVDDAPSSTNMKEKAWQGLQLLLPAVQDKLTPPFVAMLLDYVPFLPSKLVEGLKALIRKPDPGAQKAQEIEMAGREAEIEKDKAGAEKDRTGAVLNMAKALSEQINARLAPIETYISGMMKVKPEGQSGPAGSEDENIIGPTGGEPQLPPLQELGTQAQPEAQPPTVPTGIEPPSGLNGGA